VHANINYRSYNPENFATDHPNNHVYADAIAKAHELAAETRQCKFQSDSPLANKHEIEQRFNTLQDELHDHQAVSNLLEQKDSLHSYTVAKTDAIYKEGYMRMDLQNTMNGKEAAWSGVQHEVQNTRDSASTDPDYLAHREQLENFQAARSEAISHEVHRIEQEVIKTLSLENAESESESEPAPEPNEKSTAIQRDLDKIREWTNPVKPSNVEEENHVPDLE